MPDLEVESPEWWVARLSKQMNERQKLLKRYDDYYDGVHRLLFATEKFLVAFGGLFKEFSDNFCSVVVDAVAERLKVRGFRVPQDMGPQSGARFRRNVRPSEGDRDAWRIWQANQLDAESKMAWVDALVNGEVSMLVWADPDDDTTPLITVEHPSQMIVEDRPGTRIRAAALKKWRDDWTGKLFATLYLPSGIYKYQSDKRRMTASSATGWQKREVDGESWPLENPLELVPVVPFRNRPRLLKFDSEIRDVIPVQDAINKLVADMMVASEFGALPRRWATGLEVEVDPETKEEVAPLLREIDRLMTSEDPQTQFGQFPEIALSNFVSGIEMFVQHLATRTRTPPHYFYAPGAQPPAGIAIKGAETGLVAKSLWKMLDWGERCEEVVRIGFKVLGDPRADVVNSETIWGDPESRTEGEHVDATLKKQALGVPWEQLMEDLDYSPSQIDRMKELRAQEPPPAPVPADGGAQ